jgi:pyruvate dehydrogenase E2 component (dihydrolipoamide acetyltransferase)
MAEAIRMPLLSDTMTQGVIAEWHKKVGDEVKGDDVIADVETDKATMEVTPYVDGTLLYIAVDKGQGVPVNGIMAVVGKPGEDFQHLLEGEKLTQVPVVAPAQAISAPLAPLAAAPTAAAPIDATVVLMPLLSDTMTEGKIVAWHKKVGDAIKSDDIIADVETDKATMEVMPYAAGTLLYIGVPEGSAAKVNDIIAIVGKAGTDVSSLLTPSSTAPVAVSAPIATETPVAAPIVALPDVAPIAHNGSDRVKISPLARRLAVEKGISVQQLAGSGDNGRIVKRDIDNFVASPAPTVTAPPSPAAKPAPAAAPPPAMVTPLAPVSAEGYTDTPVTQMRRIIAQRLGESLFTAPHFYLTMTMTMDTAMEARKAINNVSPVKVSFNDMIIKACAMALRRHPQVNSSWMGDFIRQYNYINVGTAVAVDEGLIVPVIRNADVKSLSQIADEASKLIEKARTKKIQPQEFTGNTFTISNLGMMDIDEFTAIINPPDACILAVGKIAPTPVVEAGAIVVRQLMKVTLSCDHRVVDGAVGSRFLQTLKTYLEHPATMLV